MSHYPETGLRPKLTQACAECRRLKLKCDKNKPCSSCIRRGCPSICPEGRMVSKGSRFILANTEQLHKKIDALLNRVHELEMALEASYRVHSNDCHPLLTEEYRLVATPLDSAAAEPESTTKQELAEGLGTLTIDDHGFRYFGATGSFAAMWRDDHEDSEHSLRKAERAVLPVLAELPSEVAHLAYAFPFRLTSAAPGITLNTEELANKIIENYLPSSPEAWSLFENYWEHFAWHFTPISRNGFISRILNPLYHRKDSPAISSVPLSHRLGVLFGVFAVGELLDFTKPLNQRSGMQYHLLSRACLGIDMVVESPTVTALQGMLLSVIYGILSRGWTEPEHVWVLSGMCIKVALTLGLQHDPTKFSLPPEEVEDRWYALNSAIGVEMWQALTLGRPAFGLAAFSPIKEVPGTDEDSKYSGRHWAACFIRDIVARVIETIVASKPINYHTILQLDAKIRAYPRYYSESDSIKDTDEIGLGERLQRSAFGMMPDTILLLLHRRCFALALRDYPNDPLASPFAPSVMACYRSASMFINQIQAMLVYNANAAQRIWFFWPNVFAGTLILGSIVARSPNCSIAQPAYKELQTAIRIWEQAPADACGTKVWDAVEQVKKKAAMAIAQKKYLSDPLNPKSPCEIEGIEVTEEIQALGGGGARVVSMSSRSSSSHSSPHYPPSGDSSPSPQVGAYKHDMPITQPPQSMAFRPMEQQQITSAPSYDLSAFMTGGLYPDFSSVPQPMNFLPTEFNDIFGVTSNQAGGDVYGSDVLLGQLGFDPGEPWQPMDHVGL